MDMLLPSQIEFEYQKKTPVLYMQYTHRGMKPQQTLIITMFHHINVKVTSQNYRYQIYYLLC